MAEQTRQDKIRTGEAGPGRALSGRARDGDAKQGKTKKRGRPEKPLKIDDSPRNVARALFGLGPREFDRQDPETG